MVRKKEPSLQTWVLVAIIILIGVIASYFFGNDIDLSPVDSPQDARRAIDNFGDEFEALRARFNEKQGLYTSCISALSSLSNDVDTVTPERQSEIDQKTQECETLYSDLTSIVGDGTTVTTDCNLLLDKVTALSEDLQQLLSAIAQDPGSASPEYAFVNDLLSSSLPALKDELATFCGLEGTISSVSQAMSGSSSSDLSLEEETRVREAEIAGLSQALTDAENVLTACREDPERDPSNTCEDELASYEIAQRALVRYLNP